MAFKSKEEIDKNKAIFKKWWDNRPAFLMREKLQFTKEVGALCFDAGRKVEREIQKESIKLLHHQIKNGRLLFKDSNFDSKQIFGTMLINIDKWLEQNHE